jgi:hypothetical protein
MGFGAPARANASHGSRELTPEAAQQVIVSRLLFFLGIFVVFSLCFL